ncbi:GtrA family protein [Mesorhizobium captivum]|uniref:GtrA family protein n=1 Tax=Mesorhizobium captivum TaxID=3072319 RepID=UPI002A23F968|nr:GtrA family protein [Mesorhizobium sp. VK23E]MDX8510298.1 GtrA family protein [Mesorhizobium sp. VK23E]
MNSALAPFLQTRLFRFLTVGFGAALLLFVLSWLLVSMGLSPFTGSVVAYAISFVVAYSAQHGWTFGGKHDHATAMPRYLALQVGCAVFSGLVSHVAATRFAMPPLSMSALTTVAASAASYVLSSLWVFPARD